MKNFLKREGVLLTIYYLLVMRNYKLVHKIWLLLVRWREKNRWPSIWCQIKQERLTKYLILLVKYLWSCMPQYYSAIKLIKQEKDTYIKRWRNTYRYRVPGLYRMIQVTGKSKGTSEIVGCYFHSRHTLYTEGSAALIISTRVGSFPPSLSPKLESQFSSLWVLSLSSSSSSKFGFFCLFFLIIFLRSLCGTLFRRYIHVYI